MQQAVYPRPLSGWRGAMRGVALPRRRATRFLGVAVLGVSVLVSGGVLVASQATSAPARPSVEWRGKHPLREKTLAGKVGEMEVLGDWRAPHDGGGHGAGG